MAMLKEPKEDNHVTDDEERSEEHDAETPGASSKERKHGGAMMEHEKKEEKRHKRKRGGKVPGMKAKEHPGRRARGGSMADLNPYTSAGKMSEPKYEKAQPGPDEGGMGADSKGPHGRD